MLKTLRQSISSKRQFCFPKINTKIKCLSASASVLPKVNHLPPLVVRVGIISSAVGLATPVFVTAGVLQLWVSYLPKTVTGYYFKYLISVFGGGGIVSLSYNYVLPFFRDHSDFVLPFALSNAVASGFWFIIGEMTFGLPFMAGVASLEALSSTFPAFIMGLFTTSAGTSLLAGGLPIGGVLIGGLTALTAPFLWPLAFSICWDENLKSLILDGDSLWLLDFYQYYCMPISIPVGIVSGLSMHLILKNAILGSPGIPWSKGSLPILGTLVGMSFSYFYMLRPSSSSLLWEERMDHSTGQMISYNPVPKIIVKDTTLSSTAEMQRNFAAGIHALRQPLDIVMKKTKVVDAKKSSLVEGPVSIKHMKDRKDVFLIIDTLVRLQHLRCRNDTIARNEIQELKGKAAGTIGIADLDGFLNTVELAIIANRKNVADGDTEMIQAQTESKQLCDELKETLLSYKVNSDQFSNNGFKILSENLSILEVEFLEKLGYKIADTPEKEANMLQTYEKEKFMTKLIIYGTMAVIVGFCTLFPTK